MANKLIFLRTVRVNKLPRLGILLLALPIIVSILFFIRPYVNMQEDAWLYMTGALNIIKGRGYVDTDWMPIQVRGPIVSIIMALSMLINHGTSPDKAIILIMVLNLAGLLFLGLIGERFIGKGVGVFTMGIIFIIPFLRDYLFSRLMTDGPLAAIFFIYLYFALMAIESRKTKYWRVAGAILGIAFLTKESSILWLPVPILFIFISSYVNENNFWIELKKQINYVISFTLIVFPWWLYLYILTKKVFFIDRITDQAEKLRNLLSNNSILFIGLIIFFVVIALIFMIWMKKSGLSIRVIQRLVIKNISYLGWLLLFLYILLTNNFTSLSILSTYINLQITPIFPFYFSLFLWLEWTFISYRSKNLSSQFILILGFTFLPMLFLLAKYDNHPRNLIPWMMLSCMAFSSILSFHLNDLRLVSKNNNRNVLGFISVFLFGFAFYSSFIEINSRSASDQYRESAILVSNWIDHSITKGDTIIVTYYARREIYVLTDGDYRLVPLTPELPSGWRSLSLDNSGSLFTNSIEGENPVLIQVANTNTEISNNYLVIYPSEIYKKLTEENTSYVIITGQGRASPLGLTRYFQCWPNALGIAQFHSNKDPIEASFVYKINSDNLLIPEDCSINTDVNSLIFLLTQADTLYGPTGRAEVLHKLHEQLNMDPLPSQPFLGYMDLAKISQLIGNKLDSKYYYSLAADFQPYELLVDLMNQNVENPRDEIVLIALAQTYYKLGQFTIADAIYLNIVKNEEQSAFVKYSLGEYYYWKKDYEKSETFLMQAIDQDPNVIDYQLQLAKTYINHEKYVAAREIIDELKQQHPNSSNVQTLGNKIKLNEDMEVSNIELNVDEYNRINKIPPMFDPEHSIYINFLQRFDGNKSVTNQEKIREDFFIIDDARPILFMHPTSNYSFDVYIPWSATLAFSVAMSPDVWGPGYGDGVEFIISIKARDETQEIYQRYIDPKNNFTERQWIDEIVDLSIWAGQNVTITFETRPGPNNNANYDWAGWGEPRIIVPIRYDFMANLDQAEPTNESSNHLRLDQLEINYESRPVLLSSPNSSVIYNLTLSENPTLLFGIGMDQSVWDSSKGDGIDFDVYVAFPKEPDKRFRVFHRYYDPKNNAYDRKWINGQVDLSRFGGKQVQLIFETNSRSKQNNDFDLVAWSHPVLVDGLSQGYQLEPAQP